MKKLDEIIIAKSLIEEATNITTNVCNLRDIGKFRKLRAIDTSFLDLYQKIF